MGYGLRITPDDNGTPVVIDTSSRMLSYLGRYQVKGANDTGDTNVNVTIPGMMGGRSVIIPTKTVDIVPQPDSNLPLVDNLRSLSASGSTLTVGFHQESRFSGPTQGYIADLSVFEITPSQPQSFGIAFYDSTDFLAITDQTRFGYVVYRATINVNGTYTLPADIPNIANCVVFAHWDNPDYSVWYDRANHQIKAYGSFSSSDGSVANGVINNMQIVVVGTGFVPPHPTSGWGFIIRNAQGVTTFSSKYMPVIYKGGTFNFPYYLEIDTGSAAKEQYISVTGNVSRPMIPLCSLGFMCGDFATSGDLGTKPILYSGFKMSNYRVTTYRAAPSGIRMPYRYKPSRCQVAYNLPVLDGLDYL